MTTNDTDTLVLGAILFPGFELLDLYGPLEFFGNLMGLIDIVTIAPEAGAVSSAQGPQGYATYTLEDAPPVDILLIPGGIGTRELAEDRRFLAWLCGRAEAATYVCSVCTGAGLLSAAGLLDGRRATTNKQVFDWAGTYGRDITWVKQARWVEDGKFFTASGVTAGMDMALAVIAKLYGDDTASNLAIATEYEWHRDSTWDPFSKIWMP